MVSRHHYTNHYSSNTHTHTDTDTDTDTHARIPHVESTPFYEPSQLAQILATHPEQPACVCKCISVCMHIMHAQTLATHPEQPACMCKCISRIDAHSFPTSTCALSSIPPGFTNAPQTQTQTQTQTHERTHIRTLTFTHTHT